MISTLLQQVANALGQVLTAWRTGDGVTYLAPLASSRADVLLEYSILH
jgi:hypothetical protein